jgi:hypothetical protein
VQLPLDAPQKNPNSNRGQSISVGKKDIVGERGLLKAAFLLKIADTCFRHKTKQHTHKLIARFVPRGGVLSERNWCWTVVKPLFQSVFT